MMNDKELQERLEKHLAWRNDEEGGVRFTAIREDLRGVDFHGANLRGADLRYAALTDADLTDADLRYADLRYANLTDADLRYAALTDADLTDANLMGADLRYAALTDADLRYAALTDADLTDADLTDAKNIPAYVEAVTNILPEGDLILYNQLDTACFATLRIPAEAKRSNATGRKCRAEYAEVLAIEDANGNSLQEGCSMFDHEFIYRVGETVRPGSWCEDRWQQCAPGIHFYLTRWEAERN